MTSGSNDRAPTELVLELEQAHRQGVGAAIDGLKDAALGDVRLTGDGVPVLADAAVSSATPFLRAPLLVRLSRARLLHAAAPGSPCPTCGVLAPCPTAQALA
ncbi:hypothetical protein [Georgenia faecalis]|uniref:hypothetical protein n=1 Tax=Georgenia faecalis TaxID=2483799 RepID=UPI000FD88FB0|nr:hypothetical protein [Georgenia faecalis]